MNKYLHRSDRSQYSTIHQSMKQVSSTSSHTAWRPWNSSSDANAAARGSPVSSEWSAGKYWYQVWRFVEPIKRSDTYNWFVRGFRASLSRFHRSSWLIHIQTQYCGVSRKAKHSIDRQKIMFPAELRFQQMHYRTNKFHWWSNVDWYGLWCMRSLPPKLFHTDEYIQFKHSNSIRTIFATRSHFLCLIHARATKLRGLSRRNGRRWNVQPSK